MPCGKVMPKFLSCSLNIFLAALMILSAGLSSCLPVFTTPRPTGFFEVGTRTFHFIDESRDEIFTEDKNDKRELMVQVWYPAQNTRWKKISYLLPKAILKGFAEEFEIPEPLIDYLKYVRSYSYEDCEIASSGSPYPFIILNHGMGSSRLFHVTQAENLASHGYIVAAIDHTYSTAATLFPDGHTVYFETTEEMEESYETRADIGKVWTEDILFTIGQFEKINSGAIQSILEDKIDLDKTGVFGHSFGGAAAYDSCYDGRIKAGIDLDGSLYGFKNQESLSKPFPVPVFSTDDAAISYASASLYPLG